MLNRDAVRRALPRILDRLGGENRRILHTIGERLNEDGRVNLGELLRLLYPNLDAQSAQAKLRQLRLTISKATAKPPAIDFALDGDTQTRSQPDERWIWFSGLDPLAEHQLASVGERPVGWVEIEAERLGPVHCHVLYSEKEATEAKRFVELLRPHLSAEEIDLWTQDDILPGENLQEQTRRSESNCILAIALISPEFQADAKLREACERLGDRVIPISLSEIGGDGEAKLFRHRGKSFEAVPKQANQREWVLHFFNSLRSIRQRRGHVRFPLPPPDKDFIPGEADPFSLERGIGNRTEAPTNASLRDVRGGSAIDQLLAWANDPKASPYCALLGELGMGKTTTAKELARRIQDHPGGRVPLYFDLRNAREMVRHGDDCPGLRAILASLLEKQAWAGGPGIRPPTVDDVIQLAAQHTLIIFDGLDEVLVGISPARGQLFTRQLFSLVPPVQDAKARLLITCRSHFFRTIAEQSAHFTTEDRDAVTASTYTAFVLLPFREEQIRDYLRLTLGETDGPRAYDLISSVHNLPELAERPYTLTLIRQQFHRLEQEKAAGRRVTGLTLYRFFVEEWLLRDQGKHRIRPDDKQLLMENLAAQLARQGQRSWSARQLEVWLQEFPSLASRDFEATMIEEQDLRNATFLVRDGDDNFRFAHSSLQEYFLATHLRRALEEGRPEAWAFASGVSRETLDFLGQSLLESPSEAAQAGLRKLRDSYYKDASELALRFFVLAFAKHYPCPSAQRFQLKGANLWEFEADFGDTGDRFDLSGTCFDGARLANSFWRGCRMVGCSFADADAARSEWHRCDLRDSQWSGADLAGLLARHCDLRRADFAEASQRGLRWVLCEGIGQTKQIEAARNLDRELVVQGGHDGHVESVAWSQDGRWLASGSDDHTVKLWDLETGDCVKTLFGHGDGVVSVAWSQDGRRLASGSDDHTVKLWDAGTGECVQTLAGHGDGVSSVTWSPDGHRLASGSGDQTVKLWKLDTGECVRTLVGHGGEVNSVAWSQDGRCLASASDDQKVKLWAAETGDCLRTLDGHEGGVNSVTWSPDGRRLASGSSDSTLKLWDAEIGECLQTLDGQGYTVISVAWSQDGRLLASGSGDCTLKIWGAEAGECLRTLFGHWYGVISVAWSQDGRQLASGSYDRTVKMWSAETGECLRTLDGQGRSVNGVAWSPDGRHLASALNDKTVALWDPETGYCVRTLSGHERGVYSVAWNQDGRRLASASHDKTVKLWDPETGDCVRTLSGHEDGVYSVAWNQDGRRLASASHDNTVKLWDPETGGCVRTLAADRMGVTNMAWSQDGQRITLGSFENKFKLWDTETGECLQTLAADGHGVRTVAWSPDGRRLATGSFRVKLRDAETGECFRTLVGHRNAVLCLAWSPDGRRLASGSHDRAVKLWDADTGECVGTLAGHGSAVDSLAWSPDGSRLASGARNGLLLIHDTETYQEIQPRRYLMQVPHGPGTWAAVELLANRIVSCGPGAWRHFRWRVPGSDELLPAEAFGPLPERAE